MNDLPGFFACPNCGDTHLMPDFVPLPCLLGMANRYDWTILWAGGKAFVFTEGITVVAPDELPGDEWKKGKS